MASMPPTELLTLPEVAKRLRCCHKTVYRAVRSGKLNAQRRGGTGHYLFTEADLAAFIVAERIIV